MATECYTQLGFGFQPKLRVDFTGGTLTSDAGLLLVREFGDRHQLTADVARCVADGRDARSWPRRRRILVKLEVTAWGANLRFMATNRRGSAADRIAWYDARGEAEN